MCLSTAEQEWQVTRVLQGHGAMPGAERGSVSEHLLTGTQRTQGTFLKMLQVMNPYCRILRNFKKKEGGKEGEKAGRKGRRKVGRKGEREQTKYDVLGLF